MVSRQRVVSNGRLLWLGRRIADNFPTGELLILSGEPQKLLAEKGFVTLQTLLTNVRDHLDQPQNQRGTWKGRPVVLVTGGWRGDTALATSAKRCNIYFDEATRLPFRLEWLSSDKSGVVWEMQIRNLVVNRPLTPQALTHTFRFTSLYN